VTGKKRLKEIEGRATPATMSRVRRGLMSSIRHMAVSVASPQAASEHHASSHVRWRLHVDMFCIEKACRRREDGDGRFDRRSGSPDARARCGREVWCVQRG